ncbi:hypothetical protein Poli38472_000832 [Pythium oligandrum]|uniref:Rab-GAP TBC domain-containing protein n=1 Tax=Pythium oligandrum TaxID=41045 RepID=A0A8K1CCU9_PYTOL|nr:hypothetical protein Poli38472_000832 [Pythium oligandrum]|eukprot:TMW60790.1 hypothetical protein Poli38472_000832 [Pythium oligandrum]
MSSASDAKSPSGVSEPLSFQPNVTSSTKGGDSMWSRLFRPFSLESPMVHRFLPKLKAGRFLIEVGDKSEWRQYEIVLAGSSIGDLGLYYYGSKADQAPVGCIHLHSAHVDVLEEVLMVITQDKTWFLCANSGRDASDWAEEICAAIDRVSQAILLQGNGPRSKRRRLSSHVSAVTLKEIQSREPRARVDEFLEIFVRSNHEDVRMQAMEGALSWSCMRNLAWRLWLDVLPLDMAFTEWIPTTRIKREKYASQREQHALFRECLKGKQNDEEFIAACETTEDSLLYSIFKDVYRTQGSMDYFRSASVQCMLIRILYTYSNAHPGISYNQGMGELLATIVYLLHTEQWPGNSKSSKSSALQESSQLTSNRTSLERLIDDEDASYVYVESFIDIQDDTTYLDREKFLRLVPFTGGVGKYQDCCREAAEEIICELTLPTYIEHDAYLLLEEIMFRMAGAFCPEAARASSNRTPKSKKHKRSSKSTACTVTLFASEMASSPLYDQMNAIHHHILSRCDPPTARHIAALGLEPQMFVLRWVRVLMSREFEMAQVWQIWDAIFSLTPSDFSFINLLCVAAVREFREEILQVEDATAVLLCLRDLSDKVDADRLVDNARELYDALMIAAAVEATNGSH